MSVTVTGADIRDVKAKVALFEERVPIKIRWRATYDFGKGAQPGCIVRYELGEVEEVFKNADEAIDYIGKILRQHDAEAKKYLEEKAKEK